MPKGKNYGNFVAPGNPKSTPTGKKSDPHAGAAGKMGVGMPDGRVADTGRNSHGGMKMALRVKNLVSGRYHKSGGPRQPS